jgi:hypothetical protein
VQQQIVAPHVVFDDRGPDERCTKF